jgi:phosphatidylglycerophosphatase A
MKKVGIAVATFFGVGHLPVAPGTWASLLTALIVFFTPLSALPFVFLALITAAVYAIGIPAAGICEKHYQKQDPRQCVIDEVAGQLVSLWFLPRQAGFYIAAFHDRRCAGRILHPGYPARDPSLFFQLSFFQRKTSEKYLAVDCRPF